MPTSPHPVPPHPLEAPHDRHTPRRRLRHARRQRPAPQPVQRRPRSAPGREAAVGRVRVLQRLDERRAEPRGLHARREPVHHRRHQRLVGLRRDHPRRILRQLPGESDRQAEREVRHPVRGDGALEHGSARSAVSCADPRDRRDLLVRRADLLRIHSRGPRDQRDHHHPARSDLHGHDVGRLGLVCLRRRPPGRALPQGHRVDREVPELRRARRLRRDDRAPRGDLGAGGRPAPARPSARSSTTARSRDGRPSARSSE